MQEFDSRHTGYAVSVNDNVYLLAKSFRSGVSRYFIMSNDSDFDGSSADNKYGFQYSWIQESDTREEGIFFINVYSSDILCRISEELTAEHFVDWQMYLQSGAIMPLTLSSKERKKFISNLKNISQMKTFMLKGVNGTGVFSGLHSYHSHGTPDNYMNKGGDKSHEYWVGIELEVECNNEACEKWIKSIESNWFYLEKDGSLSNRGVEIITIRMNPKVAYNPKTWKKLVATLRELGATSHDSGRCGIHVHVSRTAFGKTEEEIDQTLGKVFHMYHNELGAGGYGVNYVSKAMRRKYVDYAKDITSDLSDNVKSTINFIRTAKLDSIKSSHTKDIFKGISNNNGQSRYVAINRENLNTIEFRQGRGTLNEDSISVTIRFVCELIDFARKSNNKNCTRENFLKKIKKLPETTPLRRIFFN